MKEKEINVVFIIESPVASSKHEVLVKTIQIQMKILRTISLYCNLMQHLIAPMNDE